MIALTPGDPAGIGPDLCCLLAARGELADVVVLGDPDALAARARELDLKLPLRILSDTDPLPARADKEAGLWVQSVPLAVPATPGQLDPRNAQPVLETLRVAVSGCLAGRFQAMVTAPLHKGVINDAGIPFTGHTEFLQQQAGVEQVVMMLASDRLRVALVTTHLPLAAVPEAITRAHIARVVHILHNSLKHRFGLAQPKMLVAGLNPHAGEQGHLGREEIEVLIPEIQHLQAEYGYDLSGPFPADTLFSEENLRTADAFLAMYHDQGLPVLKTLSFGQAVNITLGLPFLRTSVDHGTALPLAGSGQVDCGSLNQALKMARASVGR